VAANSASENIKHIKLVDKIIAVLKVRIKVQCEGHGVKVSVVQGHFYRKAHVKRN